ncbi:hypothetical protein QBC35DRAFT_477317 [Podospora australis]|uniref:Uncharacterized protein n=1 Tax=Podospora australis TaxID=1536484 RepID=A0AAN6WLM5_9PEZI|nr:hypothetical protein QBC35DRAFT_477317 [Podospora australis]
MPLLNRGRLSAAGTAAEAGLGLAGTIGVTLAIIVAVALVIGVCLCLKAEPNGDEKAPKISESQEKGIYARAKTVEDTQSDMPYYSRYGCVAPAPSPSLTIEEINRRAQRLETSSRPSLERGQNTSLDEQESREGRTDSQEEARGLLAPQATWTPQAIRRDMYR